MNFKSLFRVCVLAAMLLPIEAACSLSARPKGKPAADREYDPQTTASFFYTEGIKNNVMEGDTARSIRLFEKVLAIDSTHAPSLYELAILYAGSGAPVGPAILPAGQPARHGQSLVPGTARTAADRHEPARLGDDRLPFVAQSRSG